MTAASRLFPGVEPKGSARGLSRLFPEGDDGFGIFVASSLSGKEIRVSDDGETWHAFDVFSSGAFVSLSWSPELGRMVAGSQTEGSGNGPFVYSGDGVDWDAGTNLGVGAGQRGWADIAWSPELGIFVAVEDGDNLSTHRVATSIDGVVWTLRATPTDPGFIDGPHTWSGVAWSSELGLFVAVGASHLGAGVPNYTMSSPDGVNWTLHALAGDHSLGKVMWVAELGGFVAVGTEVFVSTDGENWGSVGKPFGRITVGLAWSPSLHKLAALGWSNSGGPADSILTSTDGVNWSLHPIDGPDTDYRSIVWSPELGTFLAVGSNTTSIDPNDTNSTILASKNGSDWLAQELPSAFLFALIWIPGLKVPELPLPSAPAGLTAVSPQSGEIDLAWSASEFSDTYNVKRATVNGGPYATIVSGLAATTYHDLSVVNGQTYYYVVSGSNATGEGQNSNQAQALAPIPSPILATVASFGGTASEVMTSPDGVAWTKHTAAVEHGWRAIAYSPSLGLFAAAGNQGNGSSGNTQRAMTSPDGTVWTGRTALSNVQWEAMAWSPALALFAAVATATSSGTRVMTSPDGTVWSGRASPAGSWTGVVWADALGLFVAVGSGANKVMTSPDGVNWTARVAGASLVSVAWAPQLGLLVAVGSNAVYSSPDGVTWTSRAPAGNQFWNGVAWSPGLGLFAAVASNGAGNRVMTSSDGVNWTSRASASDQSWNDVAWSAAMGLFVAIAFLGNPGVMTSPDGINWTGRVAFNGAWSKLALKPT